MKTFWKVGLSLGIVVLVVVLVGPAKLLGKVKELLHRPAPPPVGANAVVAVSTQPTQANTVATQPTATTSNAVAHPVAPLAPGSPAAKPTQQPANPLKAASDVVSNLSVSVATAFGGQALGGLVKGFNDILGGFKLFG